MIPGSANALLLASAAAAEEGISRSVRFNSSDGAYLSRTPASNGNRRTWTFSFWTKRGLGEKALLSVNSTSNSKHVLFRFESNDTLTFYVGYTVTYGCTTTQVFRDPSAWYHFVLAFDATASGSAKVRIYVNGEEITSFSADTRSSIADQDWGINEASILHVIGRNGTSGATYYSGYLADCFLIDGQALDPTSFGEFDDNGIWQPIAYTGSYGTNGFHLDFSDNSTAAALGTDTSGNGNTWTVNNISVTAGAGNDSVVDVPTNGTETDTGSGGEVRGNYATWNPLFDTYATDSNTTWANGNLEASATNRNWTVSSIGFNSGKWYAEFSLSAFSSGSPTAGIIFGVSEVTVAATAVAGPVRSSDSNGYSSLGNIFNNNSSSSGFATFGVGDVIGVAVDITSNTVDYYKNGSLVSSRSHTFDTSKTYVFGTANETNVATSTIVANFGQRPFAYTAPSGFKALCTANLPAPVITKPSEYMDVVTYTGNGTAGRLIGDFAFSPDLVWIKSRSAAYSHALFDTIRGVYKGLQSNATNAETSDTDALTAFGTSSFTVGTGNTTFGTNTSGQTFVAWTWDAGSSTVTNTDGSITSTVRANPSAGFSIVTFSMLSGTYTVGHGLNVVPSLLITKGRTFTSNWWVYHTSLGSSQYLGLNSTAAASSLSWGGSPTSSVFTANNNFFTNGQDYVVYAFAPVAGYSSSFSYTGNGSADGPMVWLGFRPKLILLKCSSSTSNWFMYDTARNTYNVINYKLYADQNAQENGVSGETTSTNNIDALSNGFKLRSANGSNTSAATYIGFAWAENPFQYARAR